MKKKQRIKYEYAAACRANVAATTSRYDDIVIIQKKYNFSSYGVGMGRAHQLFYSGARTS